MDLYFAGIQALELDEYLSSKNCHRLFSYAGKPRKRLQMFEPTSSKIFMDSGAFGVAHSKKEITLDEYIEFIKQTPRVNLFACLDVIPFPILNTETSRQSAEQSWQNYLYMLKHLPQDLWDKVVPTYHYGEDFAFLEQMLEGFEGYKPPYIAYGGRVGIATNHILDSLDTFFDIVKKNRPTVKVHGFGITVFKILEKHPFTSADSTSYLKKAVNGSVYLECLRKPIKISTQTQKDVLNYLHMDDQLKTIIENEVQSYGYTIQELQDSFRSRFKFNIDYFMRWQKNYKLQVPKIRKKKLF